VNQSYDLTACFNYILGEHVRYIGLIA